MDSIESVHTKQQQQQLQKMREMQQHHTAALAHAAEREEERSVSRRRPVSSVQVTAADTCDDHECSLVVPRGDVADVCDDCVVLAAEDGTHCICRRVFAFCSAAATSEIVVVWVRMQVSVQMF